MINAILFSVLSKIIWEYMHEWEVTQYYLRLSVQGC